MNNAQIAEVFDLISALSASLEVLIGSEVDIRADDSLDYPEEVLRELDVAVARRGWCEPRHILNTRPREELLAFLRQKRRALAGSATG